MKDVSDLTQKFGQLYSEALGIDLGSGTEEDIFKWFLVSLLHGKRIEESVITNTYRGFEREGVLTPGAIIDKGWRKLVIILDAGGYVRYDFNAADNLIEISNKLLSEYGSMTALHEKALDPKDLERRLMAFKGIEPNTAVFFLREMRYVWAKADPEISPYAELAAEKLKIDMGPMDRHSKDFVRLEYALLRVGKNYIRKNKPIPAGI
ncbi:MAG: hypothetical protein ACYSRP_08615 [Planctomycetota bacterium]|jgi:hypothetical protein